VGEITDSVRSVYKAPWFYSVLLLSLVPLFPDYVCFPLVIAAFLFSLCDAKQQGRRIHVGKIGGMMIAYLAYMALSLLYTTDLKGSFWTLVMWVCMFLGYLSAVTVLYDRRRLRTAILCMTAVTGGVGGVAVLQYFLRSVCGIVVDDMLWEQLDRVIYNAWGVAVSDVNFGGRVSSTFNNPNLMAAYLALTIPFSIAFVLTGNRSKTKAIARITLIAAVYALGFSFCRAGYLALIVVGCLLALLYIRKRFMMTVLTVIYVVLLIPSAVGNRLLSVIPTAPDQPADSIVETLPDDLPLPDRLEQLEQEVTTQYEKDGSVSGRFRIWNATFAAIKEKPLFGAGLGIGTTRDMLEKAGLEFKHAHNLPLEILAEGGILSLLLFCGVLYLLAIRGWRLLRRREEKEAWLLGFAVFASCGALFVFGIFDFPLITPRLISTCMLLLGITESAAVLYLPQTDTTRGFGKRLQENIRKIPCFLRKK